MNESLFNPDGTINIAHAKNLYDELMAARAVLSLIWGDLDVYIQAARNLGKDAEIIKLLDNWALLTDG